MITVVVILAPIAFVAWKAFQHSVAAEALTAPPVTGPVDYPTSWSELDERQLNRLLDGH